MAFSSLSVFSYSGSSTRRDSQKPGVEAGEMLKKGDIIGVCGGGGFNGQAGINMHVALTLQGQALNLDIAIEDGIEY